ncbi:hypothetical protein [Corynebacterium glyciniphilum]|uniref:hypothetical protein n=1 Tax=Corynebacterium glyciniphilum TaxID=1404244 RepID=UPI003FD54D7E
MSSQITLTGVDESQWIVHGPGAGRQGVQIEAGDLGDIYDAPVATTYREQSGVPGASYRGHRYLQRHIPLLLTSYANDSLSWAQIDSALRKAFSYDRDTVLTWDTDLSGQRSLRVRLEEEPHYREDIDPYGRKVARWEYPVVTQRPFYDGGTETFEYIFDGTNWIDSVTVTNPADREVWPRWVLTPPSGFILPDVGLDEDGEEDRQVPVPSSLNGRPLVVDTDPSVEMVSDPAVWAQMSGQFFLNPIPPRTGRIDLPVGLDPLPRMQWVVPWGWRVWIARQVNQWAQDVGADEARAATPEIIAAQIRRVIEQPGPSWAGQMTSTLRNRLTAAAIASAFRSQYGTVSDLIGSVAQVRLQREWTRPFGLE